MNPGPTVGLFSEENLTSHSHGKNNGYQGGLGMGSTFLDLRFFSDTGPW